MGGPLQSHPAPPEAAPPSGCSPSPPHLSHLHSHGPHRTSSARQCSGRWRRRTHSQSRAEGLEKDRGETGPRRVGTGTQPSGCLQPLAEQYRPSLCPREPQVTGIMTSCSANPEQANWLPSQDQLGPAGAHTYPSGADTRERTRVPGSALRTDCVWGVEGNRRGTRPLRQAPGFRERPVKDDGLRHSTGTGGLRGSGRGCGGSTGTSETPTSATPRGQCENGEKHEMK